MSLLEIKDLCVNFHTDKDDVRAVDHISFSLDPGRTLGIVGESGSGKSVASLAIMGLLPSPPANISNGQILYAYDDQQDPVDLLRLNANEMRAVRGKEISMIFQEPMVSLNPVMRCGKQVVEIIREHMEVSKSEARKQTLELFREVMLPRPEEAFRSYPHQLSGGQKQRIMIAMAMACNPRILIADEPTTALDVTVQQSILELMKKLQEKYAMAIIFISHDLGVVAELADEVLVMHQGKIVEQGSIDKVFRSPTHPYTKGLLACRPPLNRKLKRLPTIADFTGTDASMESVLAEFELSEEDKAITTSSDNHPENTSPILELKHVRTSFMGRQKGFKKSCVKAVDDVSMSVYQGETIGLVGESGCGKTTLGRTVLRLTDSSGGEVLFKGDELLGLSQQKMKPLRKNIQIIFQDPYSSLNPRIMVGSAITEVMIVHGIGSSSKERRQKTIDLLNKVSLDEYFYYRYPHELSGGQRQRICIARALAVTPEFIICDESVAALDVSVQAQVLNLLNDLKEEFGFTYIFISHDLSVVRFMADRIFVMKEGKFVESGLTEEVYNNPQQEYTRNLINAIPKGI